MNYIYRLSFGAPWRYGKLSWKYFENFFGLGMVHWSIRPAHDNLPKMGVSQQELYLYKPLFCKHVLALNCWNRKKNQALICQVLVYSVRCFSIIRTSSCAWRFTSFKLILYNHLTVKDRLMKFKPNTMENNFVYIGSGWDGLLFIPMYWSDTCIINLNV